MNFQGLKIVLLNFWDQNRRVSVSIWLISTPLKPSRWFRTPCIEVSHPIVDLVDIHHNNFIKLMISYLINFFVMLYLSYINDECICSSFKKLIIFYSILIYWWKKTLYCHRLSWTMQRTGVWNKYSHASFTK